LKPGNWAGYVESALEDPDMGLAIAAASRTRLQGELLRDITAVSGAGFRLHGALEAAAARPADSATLLPETSISHEFRLATRQHLFRHARCDSVDFKQNIIL
jgi:hypothetical protein